MTAFFVLLIPEFPQHVGMVHFVLHLYGMANRASHVGAHGVGRTLILQWLSVIQIFTIGIDGRVDCMGAVVTRAAWYLA